MTGQASWAIVIAAILAAAVIGFLLGRVNGNGARQRLSEVEEELGRKDAEISGYKREVDAHFDKTATLFVSMAGSYKNLFEHLSSGYEKLSEGSSRDLFRERVATLLLDGSQEQEPSASSRKDEVQEAAAADSTDAPDFADAPAAADAVEEPAPVRSEEAEALLAEEHTGPVVTAEIAEAEEQELREVAAAESAGEVAEGQESVQPVEEKALESGPRP